jgi:hypothetical protein
MTTRVATITPVMTMVGSEVMGQAGTASIRTKEHMRNRETSDQPSCLVRTAALPKPRLVFTIVTGGLDTLQGVSAVFPWQVTVGLKLRNYEQSEGRGRWLEGGANLALR